MKRATVTPLATRAYMAAAGREDWRTPPDVVELVRSLWGGKIGLDPCAPPDPAHVIAKGNMAGPAGSPADGLAARWRGTVYVNPPFSGLADWAAKCSAEGKAGAEVVLLLPARTDTAYWHDHIATAQAVCFWRGRMRFVGAPSSAPFPAALAYWGPRPWDFHRVFSPRGLVVRP